MNVGIVGLGNVGMGTIAVLTENAKQIKEKLGFDLKIKVGLQPLRHDEGNAGRAEGRSQDVRLARSW